MKPCCKQISKLVVIGLGCGLALAAEATPIAQHSQKTSATQGTSVQHLAHALHYNPVPVLHRPDPFRRLVLNPFLLRHQNSPLQNYATRNIAVTGVFELRGEWRALLQLPNLINYPAGIGTMVGKSGGHIVKIKAKRYGPPQVTVLAPKYAVGRHLVYHRIILHDIHAPRSHVNP
jgi:Tfp pilus assembly protein PilP